MTADPTPAASAAVAPGRLLRNPDFRRLWFTGLTTFLVRWLELVVYGVVTYQLSGSAFAVTLVTMLRLLPLGLFGLVFGALATRVDRRNGLVLAVVVLLASALALLLLAWFDRLAVWHLGLASFVNGTAWAADNSFRRGLMGDIAGPLRMGNAMALDVGASNACRLLGPVSGGLLFAYGGMVAVASCIVLLYLFALLVIVGVSRQPPPGVDTRLPLRTMLVSGFVAARASPLLLAALWVTILYNVFAWPVLSLVPVLGKDQLGLDPDGVGGLVSIEGGGAMLGAMVMAWLARPAYYGRVFVTGAICFMAMLPVLGLSQQLGLSMLAMAVLGIGQSGFSVMQSTLVFVAAPAERRLPAMGLLTVCIGFGPIGLLVLGWLAQWLGASVAMVSFGLTGLGVMLLSWPLWRAAWRVPLATAADAEKPGSRR